MEERRFFDLDVRLSELSRRRQGEDPRLTAALEAELEVGWIYHDHALEGIVLSPQEIKDALAGKNVAEGRDSALYEGIRAHKAALDLIKELRRSQACQADKHGLITVQLLRHLHELVTPWDKQKGSPYRSGVPLHRAYHHALAGADQIPLRMRKLCESLDEVSTSLHPLVRVAGVHIELMAIYPWPQNNGKVARFLMNLLLLRAGYPPAVIPGVERQRYHESLYVENGRLAELIADALTSYCSSVNQFFDELAELRSTPQAT